MEFHVAVHRLLRSWPLAFLWLFAACAIPAHAGTVTYIYTDPQGTPVAEADSSGNVTATYDRVPYGASYVGAGMSGVVGGPGFTGHVDDQDTALTYMQARYYDASIGRFLSVDPEGPTPGGLFGFNDYNYAANNPIVNQDPDGRECTGSLITDSSGNCKDSGSSVTSTGPGSGGITQKVKGFVKPLLNDMTHFFGSLGDSEMASARDYVPSNDDQEKGYIAGAILSGVLRAAATDGRSAEITAEEEATLILRGSRNPATASAAAYGRYMHKVYDYGAGFRREFVFRTGRRADAINFKTHQILELKPNNPEAIGKGQVQLQRYIEDAKAEFGGEWTGKVVTYDRP